MRNSTVSEDGFEVLSSLKFCSGFGGCFLNSSGLVKPILSGLQGETGEFTTTDYADRAVYGVFGPLNEGIFTAWTPKVRCYL